MMQFAHASNHLAPAEAFFEQLAFDLADGEAGVPSRAPNHGARRSPSVEILRHMRRRVARASARYELRRIVTLVRSECAAPVPLLFRARRQSGSITC